LNERLTLTGTGTSIGRVIVDSSSSKIRNYAWSGMTVRNSDGQVMLTGANVTGKDGASITAAEAKDSSWWISTETWSTSGISVWNFTEVWQWNGADGMPSLRSVGTMQMWPGYLVD